MKKLLAIALVVLLACAMLIPSQAAELVSGTVLKGTPVVDGEVEDLYYQSGSYKVGGDGFYNWGTSDGSEGTSAVAYFLWDADYLYVGIVVEDKAVCSPAGEKGWQNDAAELWFKDDGLHWKIHAANDGNFFVGADKDGKASFDFDKAILKSAPTATGYSLEIALPFAKLAAGRTLNFSLQLNDIIDTTNANGTAYGGSVAQLAESVLTCSADEVEYPVEEDDEEEVADVAADDAAAAEAPKAAKTADAAVIVALTAILGSGITMVASKRR